MADPSVKNGRLLTFWLHRMRPDQKNKKTLADQWALHKTGWRYFHALFPYIGPPAHTIKRIWGPVLIVLAISFIIKTLGHMLGMNPDEKNVAKEMFRAVSFVVSLLLAFRVNRVYDRWWTARCGFAGVGNGVTNIVRQAAVWSDDLVILEQFQRWALAWHYSVLQLITGKTQETDPRVVQLLDEDELALYSGTNKPRLLAGAMLSVLAAQAGFSCEKYHLMEELINKVTTDYGIPVRIKLQAMPYGMSLFCTGFVWIWLLLIPFGFFPETTLEPGLIVIFVAAVMMLGLDDLTNQMEDPFEYMPLEGIIATTARDVPRIVKEVQALKALARKKAAEGYPGIPPCSSKSVASQPEHVAIVMKA